MVRFLRNLLAREGFVFPPEQILTLNRFLEPLAPHARPVPEHLLHFTVEQAVKQAARAEFARVAAMSGFCSSLARTIAEFSAAGCDAGRLTDHLPDTPLGEAFLDVYRLTEAFLVERGFCLRHERLRAVAAAIARDGIGETRTIWLDGFYSLTDPELSLISALAERATVCVTLADAPVTRVARERLLAMGCREERCRRSTPAPAVALVEAASIERECDEIARRVLEHVGASYNLRDVGIVVRTPEMYSGPLRASLERFGIPARYYFERPLVEVRSVAYCAGALEALLSGWDYERTLRWLRSAFAGAPIDAFDFAVRRATPGCGLDGLRALAGDNPSLLRLLDSAQALESWRGAKAPAHEWAERVAGVASLCRPPRPFDSARHEDALEWREQAAALSAFQDAMRQTAACFPGGRRMTLADFWSAASAVLRLAMHRIDDQRRNVVNVLTAFEARQWRLPVIFVCGLVEKQFPKYQPQNPFFPDAARRALQRAGFRLRTTEDVDAEEASLFDTATTRASDVLVLSYPKADARGEQNLPSLYLDRFGLTPVTARPARPRIEAPRPPRPAVRIAAPARLALLEAKHGVLSATALERFLQCAFQFFGKDTLRLRDVPSRPEDRLDFLFRGNVAHQVIREWTSEPQPLEALFDRVFEEAALEAGVQPGYRAETIRLSLLNDLRRFTEDTQWPSGPHTEAEVKFEYELAPGLRVKGRIDRLDRTACGRAYVIDYKYSVKDPTRNELLLQGPLYLLAAERQFGLRPAAMYYCRIRDAVRYSGWGDETAPLSAAPLSREWLEAASAASQDAAAGIRAGVVEPRPADPALCGYCDFRDVCRIDTAAAAALAEGA
jgi:ATP-dependent helicase/DNAse subunit B